MTRHPWLRGALDLVLPVRCVGCGTRAQPWCADCLVAALDLRVRQVSDSLIVVAAASYDGAVRDGILGFKERGRRDLARPLGWLLRGAVDGASAGLADPVLVPMPSTRRAARRRGGEHVPRLVRAMTATAPLALVLGTREGVDGAELSASGRQIARMQSMYGRSGARELIADRDVLLVDDIVTTGATMARAAQIVRALGAHEVRGAVVAETEKQVTSR